MITSYVRYGSGYYKIGSPSFAITGPVSSHLFLSDGSNNENIENADIFPIQIPKGSDFVLFNSNAGSLGRDPAGQITTNYTPTLSSAKSIINSYPRRMLENLLLTPDENGFSVPIAGSYFVKLLDHEPGTLEPLSALITDENGYLDVLRVNTLIVDGDVQNGGGSAVWTDTTPTTETVGGITAGTTLTGLNSIEILERMLYAYQTVAFTTFNTGLGTTTIELGTSIGGGNRSTSWAANNSSNIVTNGISITYTGIASGSIASGLPYSPTTLALNYPSFSSNTIGSTLTFTIRADQQEGADATRTQVYTWRSKIYVGKNASSDYTQLNNFNQLSNTVSSLITSSSSPAVSGLEIGEGAGYVYIFVHSSLNDITSIAIGSTDQTSAFQLVSSSHSMTNSTGQSSTYKVYRSFNIINGDIILNIT